MNLIKHRTLGMLALLAAVTATAQSPPAQQPTDPNAASTPHQRDVTKTPANEAAPTGGTNPSDASTPHQKSVRKRRRNPRRVVRRPAHRSNGSR